MLFFSRALSNREKLTSKHTKNPVIKKQPHVFVPLLKTVPPLHIWRVLQTCSHCTMSLIKHWSNQLCYHNTNSRNDRVNLIQ